ncbi:MAG TPA: hypothetical protein ENJ37_06335 [Deltaproteobacteria bacterium]|nr:hypothetical protein [Deltaproteobacteria bacterium]
MEFLGVLTFLVTLYLRPQDWVPAFKHVPVDFIVIPTTVLLAVIFSRGGLPVKLPQYYFLVFLLLSIAMSNIVHGKFDLASEQFTLFAKKAMIFFMFLLVVNSPGRMRLTLMFILVLSVTLVIQGIYQRIYGVGWAGQPPYWDGKRITWVGFWNGSNVLALSFVMALPIATEFCRRSQGIFYRGVGIVAVPLLLGGLWLCNSRGGMLAAATTLFFYYAFTKGVKKGVTIILVVILLALPFLPSRALQISTKDESAHLREYVWEKGYYMLKKNPLFGVGKGRFTEFSARRLVAHNNYVQNMAELGMVGFFFWMGLLYYSFKGLYAVKNHRYEKQEDRERYGHTARTLMVMLIGFCVATMFITSEIDPFYMLLGLIAAMISIAKKAFPDLELDFTRRDWPRIFGLCIGWIMLIYLYAVKELFR